ncbi:NUDIX domain protein [Penicillium cataractarum]|uniref:NUDIX domain protein n=1 Tax=Penicillium cataractarum TaxID=2100454 RepID=A0A9W9SJ84_9EURO|nr:NUDIX domain protein [Penicillium cataractarum]KAJ5377308.1 NUDIX domain protein [Penicillium cataractarum]
MAPLNAASQEAIDRLRGYTPPPTAYGEVPLSRRAAVLILLYADLQGDLRVVITIRAKTLSSYAGEAALPGATISPPGKADTLSEAAFQTARREACEEIGLPDIAQPLPPPFSVEHLCELPANLAKTELVVRPCVALLHSFDPATGANADPETELIPRLDAREVAAVFTARFDDFLRLGNSEGEGEGDWYRGSWSLWHNSNWRSKSRFPFSIVSFSFCPMLVFSGLFPFDSVGQQSEETNQVGMGTPPSGIVHQFFVRSANHAIKPRSTGNKAQNAAVDRLTQQEESGQVQHYRVFGMTARIIVDAARVAFAREPEFEHNSHFGDEEMIAKLRRLGRLSEVRRPGDELTRETMERAAKLS